MIDVIKLEKTLHKGKPTFGNDPEDLYIYKDFSDGTGILTDGLNCYFCYNDFKSVGDACPQDSRLVNEVETIILERATTVIDEVKTYKSLNPTATSVAVYDEFKSIIVAAEAIK